MLLLWHVWEGFVHSVYCACFVNVYSCHSFPFGFEGGWMWDLIVLIPDHCLSINFVYILCFRYDLLWQPDSHLVYRNLFHYSNRHACHLGEFHRGNATSTLQAQHRRTCQSNTSYIWVCADVRIKQWPLPSPNASIGPKYIIRYRVFHNDKL